MTDTNTLAPTDAEIIALADETRTGEPGRDGYILPISFARAVLAKFGAPAPAASEALITIESSLRFRLACAKDDVEQLEFENRRLRERVAQAQDAALIRQMLEALEHHTEQTRRIARTDDAITAARLQLESKP